MREVLEHNRLVSLVLAKDVTGRLDNITTQSTKRSYKSIPLDDLVTERPALVARVSDNTLGGLILDEIISSLQDFQLWENTKLFEERKTW